MGTDVDCAIGLHRLSDREAAVHVVRYDYDEVLDGVPRLDRLVLEVRLGRPFRVAKGLSPSGPLEVRLAYGPREVHRLEIVDAPLYSVVLLQG
jgi:hypothetical protein